MREAEWFMVTCGYNYDSALDLWFVPSSEKTEFYYPQQYMYGSKPLDKYEIDKIQRYDFLSIGRHELAALPNTYKEQVDYYTKTFVRRIF